MSPADRRPGRRAFRPRVDALEDRTVPAYFAPSDVPTLNSLPGAPTTLFIDFYGGTAPPGFAEPFKPFSVDNDLATLTPAEADKIREIWGTVAEKFAPFAVNVTTVAPPADAQRVARAFVTSSREAGTGGGYSGIDKSTGASPTMSNVSPNVYWDGGGFINTGEVVAHEFGHAFNLPHQGLGLTDGTYPIMGGAAPGHYDRGMWWYGAAVDGPTGTLIDEVSAIAKVAGFRPDEAGDTAASAAPVSVSGTRVTAAGVIGTMGDADYWSFTTTGGAVSLGVGTAGGTPYSVLRPKLRIVDAGGSVVVDWVDPDAATAAWSGTLPAGSYRVVVASRGVGPQSRPDYFGFNVGSYVLTGTAPGATPGGTTFAANPVSAPGFEGPDVGANAWGAFRYQPLGTAWAFGPDAGVTGNGSGFTAGNPPAPDGTQAAFLRNAGSFSQTLVLPAGPQTLTFRAAQRGNYQPGGPQTVEVLVDGNVVGRVTPAGTGYQAVAVTFNAAGAGPHVLTFRGTTATGDSTAFVDTVAVNPVVRDGGFESPAVGAGSWGAFRYQPLGTAWAFGPDAGVAGNGSGFTGGNPTAPEGTQTAFLRNAGTMTQTVTLGAGSYGLSFQAAQRGNYQFGGPQTVQVLVDGAVVGAVTPAGTAYQDARLVFTVPVGGAHAVTLRGTNATWDSTAFVDGVSVYLVSGAPGAIANAGFEAVPVGTGPSAYRPQPAGAEWFFGADTGVVGAGGAVPEWPSTAVLPPTADGTQAAFLRNNGQIAQAVVLDAGTYTLTFRAAQGTVNTGQRLRVLVDGVGVGDVTPASSTFQAYSVTFTVGASGPHTLAIRGLNGGSSVWDPHYGFLDGLALTRVS